MSHINYFNIAKSNWEEFKNETSLVKNTVFTFKENYPEIDKWFTNKVTPGLISGDRSIIFLKYKQEDAGFAIVKNDLEEKKICTFYIFPEFRGKGIASKLFEESFNVLGTDKPLMTIPENRFQKFKKYTEKFQFKLTMQDHVYQNISKELVFNGSL
ncbi:GNAT family N-acetyltransferase [Flagellimonas flava]|uniref:GNAT family N-acetyltransferase n=1 Tax=Flagellimonas flava TaxID=570519 RepID=UPI003D65A47E